MSRASKNASEFAQVFGYKPKPKHKKLERIPEMIDSLSYAKNKVGTGKHLIGRIRNHFHKGRHTDNDSKENKERRVHNNG